MLASYPTNARFVSGHRFSDATIAQKTAGLQALRKMLFTQGTSNPAAEAELIFSALQYAWAYPDTN
jgi:hypothetical protein